eukprot:ANDGO_04908.mRNA.1 hypothetical protein
MSRRNDAFDDLDNYRRGRSLDYEDEDDDDEDDDWEDDYDGGDAASAASAGAGSKIASNSKGAPASNNAKKQTGAPNSSSIGNKNAGKQQAQSQAQQAKPVGVAAAKTEAAVSNSPKAPEEDADARKRRILREQQQAELEEAEKFAGSFARVRLEVFVPETEAEFTEFEDRVATLVLASGKNKTLYKGFVERLVKKITAGLSAADIKGIASGLSAVSEQKQATELANSVKEKAVVSDDLLSDLSHAKFRKPEDDDDDGSFM